MSSVDMDTISQSNCKFYDEVSVGNQVRIRGMNKYKRNQYKDEKVHKIRE